MRHLIDDPNAADAVAVWERWRDGPVRRYKGAGVGPSKARRCVACFPRSVAGIDVPLAHGVTIVLCNPHRDVRFIASRGGRDFLASIPSIFEAVGLRGNRYAKAVQSLADQVGLRTTATPRRRPGSYAWPGLRACAEAAWASGGSYHQGESLVLAAFGNVAAEHLSVIRPPSRETVRRWWRQRRWLSRRPGEDGTPPRTRPEPDTPTDGTAGQLADRRLTHHPPADKDPSDNPADHWLRVTRRRGRRSPPRDPPPEGGSG